MRHLPSPRLVAPIQVMRSRSRRQLSTSTLLDSRSPMSELSRNDSSTLRVHEHVITFFSAGPTRSMSTSPGQSSSVSRQRSTTPIGGETGCSQPSWTEISSPGDTRRAGPWRDRWGQLYSSKATASSRLGHRRRCHGFDAGDIDTITASADTGESDRSHNARERSCRHVWGRSQLHLK